MSVLPWYAIRVKSNRERVTARALAGRGYQVCLPSYRARRSSQERDDGPELPLFPGYLFCRFEVTNRLPVLTVPGIVHIVSFGSAPEPVDESEMAAVLTVLKSGLPVLPHAELPVGQRIQLARGPLAGAEGVILAHKNGQKFIASITLLQRSVAVEVESQWVRQIGQASPIFRWGA